MEVQALMALGQQALNLQTEVESIEAQLKEKRESLRKMLEDTIPSAMIEAGAEAITLTGGASVSLAQIFSCSIPAMGSISKAKPDQRKALLARLNGALAWLRKNKGGGLIKSTLVIDLENDKQARELSTNLKKQGFIPVISKTVHPGSLKSFLKEKWANDVEIPTDLFDVYTGIRAEIDLPKQG